jgi:serine-type D-Ala-D-Ala carboxypeptidase/endopeptidase (penicillin-binding protein 4)
VGLSSKQKALTFFFLGASGAWASTSLESAVDELFRSKKIAAKDLGVSIYSLSEQKEVLGRNVDKVFSPASTVKILTALTALRRLGPDYRFQTSVRVENLWDRTGLLKGKLYLVGGGDPSLSVESLYRLARELKRRGLRKISGSLAMDDWIFDQERFDSSRIPSESERPYNAPAGGLSLNRNTVRIFAAPGSGELKPLKLTMEPDSDTILLKNLSKTTMGSISSPLVIRRSSTKDMEETLTVSGQMALTDSEVWESRNIVNPWAFAGGAFKKILAEVGIIVTGKLEHSKLPEASVVVAEAESLPLSEILFEANKNSNNFVADSIVKTLGHEVFGKPGTMEKGIRVVGEEANRLGINNNGFRFVSGSGLTRYNRMSPKHFTDLFRAAFADFDVLPEWLSSLSIAGIDGTLGKRMHGNPAFGRFRGKTGTIDGVSALTGLVQTKKGELLAYAVLINRSSGGEPFRQWQDTFGRILAEYQPPEKVEPDSKAESAE